MKKFEFIIITILMFYTFQLSYHALDTNCIALYTYSEKDLESILKNPTREDLWFLVEKIEIMDECKYRDYTNFLKIAAKSNLEVDFR